MTPFIVTLAPGKNADQSSAKLAHLIVERWMPDNRGGVHVLITPRIARAIKELWDTVNQTNQEKHYRVCVQGNVPAMIELDD